MKNYTKKPNKEDSLKAQGFYQSRTWQRARRMALQRDHYICQHCLKNGVIKTADEVHHIQPLEDFPALSLELSNLVSLCRPCHEATKVKVKRELPPVRIIKI